MDPQTLLLGFSIALFFGALSYLIAQMLERARLQPQIEEANRLKLQLELRRQKEQETADARIAEAQERIREQAARCIHLEQLLAALQNEAAGVQAKMNELENVADTARQGTRDLEQQLLPVKTRVVDLEGALSAERGRLGALQTALEAKQDLVNQLSNELHSTNQTMAGERTSAAQREAGLREQLAEHEKTQAGGSNQGEALKAELDKARATQAALEQDAEVRAHDWTRKLAAADQKYQMLQREYMSLVNSGGHSDAAAAIVAAEEHARTQERARQAEARLHDLEEQLAQSDAGTRKKLRETEYRVCELEFKLAEADEAKATAVAEAIASLSAPPPVTEEPRPEYLAKLHEELAAIQQHCRQLTHERDEARSLTQPTAALEN